MHGACVRDGAWWHRTGELLEQQGVASAAAALPSCGEAAEAAGSSGPGLAEDVASVRRVLTSTDEPTVVVAHGYGGIVTAEAAHGVASERHLLLISSYLPTIGESLSSFGDGTPAPFLDFDPVAGTFDVHPEALGETFLQDCDPDITTAAMTRLARQGLQVTGQPVSAAAWLDIPVTYLVCTQDRGTPPEPQREYARRADNVLDMNAGHQPFLSQPAAVRDLVLRL